MPKNHDCYLLSQIGTLSRDNLSSVDNVISNILNYADFFPQRFLVTFNRELVGIYVSVLSQQFP